MIVSRTYSREELNKIFKTNRIDVIKSKLTRQGYAFTTEGRGQALTLTITELPQRFKTFCIEELAFEPQTDFDMLKKFFYMIFLVDGFIQLPYSEMERQLQDTLGISRQTISKWFKHLEKLEMIHRCGMVFNYYIIRKKNGVNNAESVPREEYATAWKPYWENKYTMGADNAFSIMKSKANGVPYKNGVVNFNGFEGDKIDKLIEILLEEKDNTMDEVVKQYKDRITEKQDRQEPIVIQADNLDSPAADWDRQFGFYQKADLSDWMIVEEEDRTILMDKVTKEIIGVSV